ncbi:hypothetical protein B0H14DRAFT_3475369 [Mycena olivaceomarginata]|nr:hypothetical protein B0H14DRAFT_3475369 [Mycena olivaceomarginata]
MASSGNDNMEVDGEATPQHQQQGTASSGSNPSQQQGTPSSGSNPSQQQDTPSSGSNPSQQQGTRLRAPLLLGQAESGNKRTARPTELQHQPLQRSRKKWAIPRTEVSATAVGVQKAMHLHLRVLMELLSQSAVPKRLSAEDMAPFNARFIFTADIDAHMTEVFAAAIEPTGVVAEHVVAFLRSAKTMSSQTAMDAARIGEHHLRTMFGALANAGLPSFTPDVFGNPESLYNIAHELVALHSFRIVATNYAIAKDDHLIQRFYRSFIYGYMKSQAGIEERRPGQVVRNVTLNNVLRRRDDGRLASNKCTWTCFKNPSVAALVGNQESHSDDEELPDRTGYRVHKKPRRDSAVTALFKEYCQTWADIQQWRKLETTAFMTKYGAAKACPIRPPHPR